MIRRRSAKISEIIGQFKKKFDDLQMQYDEEMERAEAVKGTEAGIVKSVKVYTPRSGKLRSVTRWPAATVTRGRRQDVKEEDMRISRTDTPVEIVLESLGVPSRMNVGQVLERIGLGGEDPRLEVATPVFDGIKEKDIRGYLKQAGLPETRQTHCLTDAPGNSSDQRFVVGYIYMMSWALVATRSTPVAVGPYSLVTQHRWAARRNTAGQRFGEMEVWAMEAYGRLTRCRILTVKSDDVRAARASYETSSRATTPRGGHPRIVQRAW